jgi:hypothetical protein
MKDKVFMFYAFGIGRMQQEPMLMPVRGPWSEGATH